MELYHKITNTRSYVKVLMLKIQTDGSYVMCVVDGRSGNVYNRHSERGGNTRSDTGSRRYEKKHSSVLAMALLSIGQHW